MRKNGWSIVKLVVSGKKIPSFFRVDTFRQLAASLETDQGRSGTGRPSVGMCVRFFQKVVVMPENVSIAVNKHAKSKSFFKFMLRRLWSAKAPLRVANLNVCHCPKKVITGVLEDTESKSFFMFILGRL